ncbi:MAG: c-type cytochrome biogenesis protein CcmI [Gammaproteobacteria bacterium]
MIDFWIIIFAMTLVALAFVIVPLLRVVRSNNPTTTQSHLVLYQERLQTLQQQVLQGEITQFTFEQSCLELQKILLQDVPQHDSIMPDNRSSRIMALILLITFPLIAGLWYWQSGDSRGVAQWRIVQQQAALVKAEIAQLGSPEQIAAALRTHLQQDPQSAKGWYLLGSLYIALQHYPQAVAALERANQLQPNDPAILVKYAEALFFSHNTLNTQAQSLLNRALQITPPNVNALNLLATGAYQAGNYATAIHYWEQLLQQFPADSSDGKALLAMIAEAQKNLQQHPALNPVKLSVHVMLAANIRALVSPTDSVFIYAKAELGPPMPLAVVRKQVKDLPCTVILDQSQAMTSSLSLQDAKTIRIVARISKSGQALPQTGDWQGISNVIKTQHPPSKINVQIGQQIF